MRVASLFVQECGSTVVDCRYLDGLLVQVKANIDHAVLPAGGNLFACILSDSLFLRPARPTAGGFRRGRLMAATI